MKIKTLRLSDYKRFHDLTIQLGDSPKRVIALVGPNGCGKSSVLDAMIFHSSAYEQIGSQGAKGYEYHSLKREPRYNYQSVQIIFEDIDILLDVYLRSDGVTLKLVLDRDDEAANAVIPKDSKIIKIKLNRREFENYLFDFDVLSASYPKIHKSDYDKIVTDIVNDDVKAQMNNIKNLCGEKDIKQFKIMLVKNFPKNSAAYLELEKLIFS
jgi:AAA15 family ATPase/GTPase